jgi:ribosomal-protein-alanine acetyltransferase
MRELELRSETAAHWNTAEYDALFAADAQIRIALIAAENSAEPVIQGFLIARCLPDEWEIENIVVDEKFRRSGVGSSLVQKLLAESRTAGVSRVILEVRESNFAAMRLYESIGFKPEGRRKNYYQHPAEDAVLYSLSIANL